MNDLDLNKPAGVLIKTTLIDFPGHVAGLFFLNGCNLRCPYCYNIDLVIQNQNSQTDFNSVNDLFQHLEKRKNVLSGLVISGGEPLLNPYLETIIKFAKQTGYKIKLDTNGTLPEKLEELINNPDLKPDYIAMDIKTSLKKYHLLTNNPDPEKILNSINLLSKIPSDSREFRTVLVPSLVNEQDLIEIATLLPSDARWFLAQFQNHSCLNPEYNKIPPYTYEQLEILRKTAAKIISGTELR